MNKTKIDWKDLGFSWNPVVGCNNRCEYCYARKISNRFKMIPDFSKPEFFPGRLCDPYMVKKPSTIFVGSMCDIFSMGVESKWIEDIIEVCEHNSHHTFMFLTKRPEHYRKYNWPINCWLGTTTENYLKAVRYSDLIQCNKNNKKFLSIEPILSDFEALNFKGIDLIIIGADSTPGAVIPPLEWVKSIKHPNIWYKRNLRKHYPELINK